MVLIYCFNIFLYGRVDFDILEDRYDSSDNLWKGYQKIKLKQLNELN